MLSIQTNGGRYDSLKLPGADPVEVLDHTSEQLLAAVRDDTLSQFVSAHPDWLTTTP